MILNAFRIISVALCALLSVLTMRGNIALRGNCFYADARVVRPYLVDDLVGQRYLFGGKEREHAGGRNAYDFGARILTPYGSWSAPDPLARKFYPLSPYSYCGGDPINRVDQDGKKWIVTEEVTSDGQSIRLCITGVVINASSSAIDLSELAIKIIEQLQDVYTFTSDDLNVTMTAEIRVAKSADDISPDDHIFAVVDQDKLKTNSLARTFYNGNEIEVGTIVANQTLTDENTRTISHEVGHSGGLHDTNLDKNTLPIKYNDINLMTQIAALQNKEEKNSAIFLEPIQINQIVNNYKTGKLNKFRSNRFKYSYSLYR